MIAIMEHGRLAQVGTPLEIAERPASDFVRDFVGVQGIGLKLLAVRRVADRMRPGEAMEGEPISADATLAEAMAEMVVRRVGWLPVRGRDEVTGVITLADLVR